MNGNDLNNSTNNSYKASGNLNTIIGNPDIKVQSTMTSNILENNQANVNNSSENSAFSLDNDVIVQGNEIPNSNSNEYVNNSSNNDITIQNSLLNNSNSSTNNLNNYPSYSQQGYMYENVYQSTADKKKKKTFVIPSEFITAIIVVAILLISLMFFDPIFDFFRSLIIL
mgnify:CR=1 FL=1